MQVGDRRVAVSGNGINWPGVGGFQPFDIGGLKINNTQTGNVAKLLLFAAKFIIHEVEGHTTIALTEPRAPNPVPPTAGTAGEVACQLQSNISGTFNNSTTF